LGNQPSTVLHTWAALDRFLGAAAAPVVLKRFGPSLAPGTRHSRCTSLEVTRQLGEANLKIVQK